MNHPSIHPMFQPPCQQGRLPKGTTMNLLANRTLGLALATTLACASASALAAPRVAPSPAIPAYGQAVSLQLTNAEWPTYIPVTRYTRNGSNFVVDYEMLGNNFSAGRSDFGYKAVTLGELSAGNYSVTARIFDMSNSSAAPTIVTTNFAVMPPEQWGAYPVPQQPEAYESTEILIRSAAYFDAASMKTSISGNVIRVDFDYSPEAPGPNIPAGLTTFASVKAGHLAPGSYRIEAYGRPRTGGESQKYFTKDFTVGSMVTVYEFYEPTLDHYFVAAGPDEIAALDAGQASWKRTGQKFMAWLKASDAPASAKPVCRFYARGPNSHFYTADATECQTLRNLEAAGKAQAASTADKFWGWTYEGVAFYALTPSGGACPGDTDPVYRYYNGRAKDNDTNHRFTVDPQLRSAMQWSWIDEGAVICSPR